MADKVAAKVIESAGYSPSHIANYFLDRAESEGRPVSLLKLIKLVYLAYGWSIALDYRLFDEPIVAWKHGPVIRSLYHEFKHFGAAPIKGHSTALDLDTGELTVPRVPDNDRNAHVVLKKIWEIYKDVSASSLRNITHEKGSPWTAVFNDNVRNIPIPDDLVAPFFFSKIRNYLAHARAAE